MKQKKKVFSLVISIALIAVIGIGATLAYMTSTAGTVTNTFTVGNIKAHIYEHEVNGKDKLNGGKHKVYGSTTDGAKYDGTADDGYLKRVNENSYHLIPGDVVDKDPFMTIDAGSADCYVFIQLSGVDALIKEDSAVSIDGLLGTGSKWEEYKLDTGAKYDGIYIYKPSDAGYKVEISDAKEYVTEPLFTGIKYDSTGKGSNIIVKEGTGETQTITTKLTNKIQLKGAAVQFEGMKDKNAAYVEVKTFFYPEP